MSRPAPYHRRNGTVLIVAMIVTFALAGTVLVLCRTMRVEVMASGNLAAAAQASAVARGAEQYVVALITDESENVRDLDESYFSGVRVGDGLFWIVRPTYDDDPELPLFGLVEESAKVNINGQTFDQLSKLPNMPYEAASSIMDWLDNDHEVERDGAEMDFYLNRAQVSEPYYPKNGRLETVEELLMIRGFDRLLLYGDGTAPPLGQRSDAGLGSGSQGGAFLDKQLAKGLFDLVTVYSRENNTTRDGQQRIRIGDSSRNINQDGNQNNAQMRQRLQQRLEQRLSQSRATEIVQAIGTDDMNDVFQFYQRAKSGARMTEQEFDQIYDDLTTRGNGSVRGLININSAPRSVLNCISGLKEGEADKILARRRTVDTSAEATNGVTWAAEALGVDRAVEMKLASQITTRSNQWSADILTVSGNGRAFKRVRIVVDNRQGTPSIVYRRDLTDRGWPMDKSLLANIRAGQYTMPASAISSFASASGMGGGRS